MLSNLITIAFQELVLASHYQHCKYIFSMVEYDNESYPIHKAAYYNDVQSLSRLISEGKHDITVQDPHGNTPLHIATMLGHRGLLKTGFIIIRLILMTF